MELYPNMPTESLYCSLRQHSDQRLLIHFTGVFVVKGCTICRKFPQLCLCEEMKHFSVVLFKLQLLVLWMDLPLWCAWCVLRQVLPLRETEPNLDCGGPPPVPCKHVPRSRDFDQNFGVQITKKKRGYGVHFWAFLSIASSDSVRLQKVMGSFWKNGQNFIDLNFCKI